MERVSNAHRVRMLGELQVFTEDGEPVALPGDRVMQRLLVALALRAGQPRRMDELISAVWSGTSAINRGSKSLEAPISRLRAKAGMPIPLRRATANSYRLDLPRGRVDALDFLDTVRADQLDAAEIARLLGLWRGDPRAIFDDMPGAEWAALSRGLDRFAGHIRMLPVFELRQLGAALEDFADLFPDLALEAALPTVAAPSHQRRLLIVENDVNVAKMLASILYDYQTTIAVTLAEAMQIVTEQLDELDGALVDLHLTERLDSAGLEVLSYIRDRRPELPRMLITASPPAGSQEQMRRVYGIIDTLVKGADGYSAGGVRDVVGQMFNEAPESARRRSVARLESHASRVRRQLTQRTIAANRGIRAGERTSYRELERCTGALEQFERNTDELIQQLSRSAPSEFDHLIKDYVDRWPLSVHDAGAAE